MYVPDFHDRTTSGGFERFRRCTELLSAHCVRKLIFHEKNCTTELQQQKKNELISSTSQFLVSARHSIFLGEKTTNSFSAFSAFSHHQPWPIPQKEFVFPQNTISCCSGLKKTLNRKFWYQFLKLEHSAAWLSDV